MLWTRRSYCILSEVPDFAGHYRFLRRILAGRRDASRTFLAELARYRDADRRGEGSETAGEGDRGGATARASEDGIFSHILANEQNAYSKKHLRESSSLLFAIRELVNRLSLDNILAFVAAVLCEKSVIVLGDRATGVHALSSAVLSIIPLIWPYEYQSVIMPFVPAVMEDVMDAPVPYVIGCIEHADVMARREAESYSFESVIVDIVNDSVLMPRAGDAREPAPRLNDLDALRQGLSKVYDELSCRPRAHPRGWGIFARPSTSSEARPPDAPGRADSPFSMPQAEERLCREFSAIFSEHLASIARRAATYTITDVRGSDRRSVLLEETFIKSYAATRRRGASFFGWAHEDEDDDSRFVAAFINTQIFMDYYRGSRPPSM